MSDLDQMRQADLRAPLPPTKTPSLVPWAILAVILVAISLAIHFWWPLPLPMKRASLSGTQTSAVFRYVDLALENWNE